jgi:hypothetical protein
MGRLIDADAFKTQVSAMAVKFRWDTNKALSFLKIIDNQPTSYDVDKVVERLKETKCSKEDANHDLDCFVRNEHVDMCIAIVKGAVKDETGTTL